MRRTPSLRIMTPHFTHTLTDAARLAPIGKIHIPAARNAHYNAKKPAHDSSFMMWHLCLVLAQPFARALDDFQIIFRAMAALGDR